MIRIDLSGFRKAEQLLPPGEAIVLIGHRRVDLSTPNDRAPVLLDGGADNTDPRLLGLKADDRAVLRAVENEESAPTYRDVSCFNKAL